MVLVVGAVVETVMKVEHVAVVVFLQLLRVFINGVVTVVTVMVLILLWSLHYFLESFLICVATSRF